MCHADYEKVKTFITERETTEEKELPNWQSIGTLSVKENCNYSGTLESDTIKQTEMKGKVRKE